MATESTQRTNEQWLSELREEGLVGERAQVALRVLVAGAVRKATSARGTLDESTLDDLTQVAVVHVLNNLDRFEGRSKFSTWAYAVSVRAAFSELRKASYRALDALPVDGAVEPTSDARPPASRAERNEIVDVMHRIIDEELTDRQRTAILAELAGTPQEDLLEQLGANRNALYKLVHDARRKLKQGLLASGICDDQVREAFDL